MSHPKTINSVLNVRATLEGAGVRLHRGFANAEVPRFDPFLLFDDFSSPNPADYLAGFPMHPHRGIETVTYILDGDVRHRDSIGNAGVIGRGDVQWMSSGSGIIHEEMPEGSGGLKGFQLWVNLPKASKMSAPAYQEIKSTTIPTVALSAHATGRLIAGDFAVAGESSTIAGPVKDIAAKPLYIDITLERGKDFNFPVMAGHTTFVYIFDGAVGLPSQSAAADFEANSFAKKSSAGLVYTKGTVVLFDRPGDMVMLRAGSSGARFLLVSGKPLGEPVAWYGPVVMNTQAELQTAFDELAAGEFVK